MTTDQEPQQVEYTTATAAWQAVGLLRQIETHLRTIKWGMVAVALLLVVLITGAHAAEHRSPAVKAEFQRMHPCPATGKTRGACPGYVKDHIVPLCAGGPDAASNMQWQTVEAGKAKDKLERAMCAKRTN